MTTGRDRRPGDCENPESETRGVQHFHRMIDSLEGGAIRPSVGISAQRRARRRRPCHRNESPELAAHASAVST